MESIMQVAAEAREQKKLKGFTYDVCVVGGLGHAGLPLGISFAKVGKKVVLHDTNDKAMQTVLSGKMPFMEAGAEAVLRDVLKKTLFISSEKKSILESRFVIITIGTPIDEHLNPKFVEVKRFFSEIVDYIRDDQHIILRSTVYPGTAEKILYYLRHMGKQTRLSFAPERIAEGKAMEELWTLPQIIASFDEESFQEAEKLFLTLTKEIIRLQPLEAELAKLFTNVWRYILFAISNEFYQIATHSGVDFYKVYHAMTHHYPRTQQGLARAGFAAGPCLLKDTMQLAAYDNNSFFLGHAAMLINEGLPNFIIQRLKEKDLLKNRSVGILGMTFKPDHDDTRDSLSYKLKKILEIEAKEVRCSDAYVEEEEFVSAEELIHESDIIIVGAPHKQYANLTIPKGKLVVDIWNLFGKGGLF